jgi:hypothetical protein
MSKYNDYKKSLEAGFRAYREPINGSKEFDENMIDPKHGLGHQPVFKREDANKNIIVNGAATEEEKRRLFSLVPGRKRHKWFRSMKSSQALALSFFGNLVIYGNLEWLSDLKSDDDNNDGPPAFGQADLSPYNFSMEHEVAMLDERRPTSLDVFISGRYRVAVECKLSEEVFGNCTRPRRGLCDGFLRNDRCALAKKGARYWDYIPMLFDWPAEPDYKCPLKTSYQLARNVLAACVREDGFVSPSIGHALVIYDKRNPKFSEGGKEAEVFRRTQNALRESQALRKISWQRIAAVLWKHEELRWLFGKLEKKYGIKPEAN